MKNTHSGNGLSRGVRVFGGLLVLTLLEFWVAVGLEDTVPSLALIMIAKAALILDYYMHIRAIADGEGDH